MTELNVSGENTIDIRAYADKAIGSLHMMAELADAEYFDQCLDSLNTNPEPTTPAQKFVRLMMKTIMEINASGLCDSGEFERFVGYEY
jgi:hypothetical protein